MPLIELRKDWLIHTDNIVNVYFDEDARSLRLYCRDQMLQCVNDEAVRVWAMIREHVVPRTAAIRETMTGLEDICRRVAALERMMEVEGAGIDIGKRLAAVDARLGHVEARVFKAGDDAEEPEESAKPEPAAPDARALATRIVDAIAITLWPYPAGKDLEDISRLSVELDGPRAARIEWVARRLAEFAGSAPSGVRGPHYLGCPQCRCEDLDNPGGADEFVCRKCGKSWEMYELARGTPMAPKPIDPDAPRRFRWPKTEGGSAWGYGVYFPAVRMTCTEMSTWLDADPSKLFVGFRWIDPAPPIHEPDGSTDRADIATPPGWVRTPGGDLKHDSGWRIKEGDAEFIVMDPGGFHHKAGWWPEEAAILGAQRLIERHESESDGPKDRADIATRPGWRPKAHSSGFVHESGLEVWPAHSAPGMWAMGNHGRLNSIWADRKAAMEAAEELAREREEQERQDCMNGPVS